MNFYDLDLPTLRQKRDKIRRWLFDFNTSPRYRDGVRALDRCLEAIEAKEAAEHDPFLSLVIDTLLTGELPQEPMKEDTVLPQNRLQTIVMSNGSVMKYVP